MEKLLTVKDLATLLGLAEKTIRWKACRTPEVLPPSVQIPGCRIIRFRESDVKAWLDNLTVTGQETGHGSSKGVSHE